MSDTIKIDRDDVVTIRDAVATIRKTTNELRLTSAERNTIQRALSQVEDASFVAESGTCEGCGEMILLGDMHRGGCDDCGPRCEECAPTVGGEMAQLDGLPDDEEVNETGATAGECRAAMAGMDPDAKRYLEPWEG